MLLRTLPVVLFFVSAVTLFAQGPVTPPIEAGVSQELAKWRAARYSDVRYKLNLTLEKMSPVLKGTMEIRIRVSGGAAATQSSPPYEGGVDAALGGRGGSLIILDWRKIKGYEDRSTISNVFINDRAATQENHPVDETPTPLLRKEGSPDGRLTFNESNEHLIFRDGVVIGENVIKLDFTSPILTSGSAITRYVDKEDGAEYIYSLFVPNDASTAFPVFDQPDLKAYFDLEVDVPNDWNVISNGVKMFSGAKIIGYSAHDTYQRPPIPANLYRHTFTNANKPISTYVFAFAAGPFERVSVPGAVATKSVPPAVAGGLTHPPKDSSNADGSMDIGDSNSSHQPSATAGGTDRNADLATSIYVRKSQAEKFKPHAAEVFRLNREAIKYFEEYFDYKFPFPKYDLVLIPEFPFGGMEHAGATFLRESAIIFPQEPTKNDHISRAVLIFHEAAHQWFGDTVTMRWFDDLWLKEGFANFAAYKAMERIMPEANAWKVFYERIKQGAYQTDSTKGTTPIYQEIKNLSAAKSAYGNIVYNKAPAFLRVAENFIDEDNFRTAVRSFIRKHQFGNASWGDLVKELENVYWERERKGYIADGMTPSDLPKVEKMNREYLRRWAALWITQRGVQVVKTDVAAGKVDLDGATWKITGYAVTHQARNGVDKVEFLPQQWVSYLFRKREAESPDRFLIGGFVTAAGFSRNTHYISDDYELIPGHVITPAELVFANHKDYGYGIFLLDDKSRDYVLKNIQNEKDPFLRSMMWGSLWDSVREGELDPREYVELVVKVLSPGLSRQPPKGGTQNEDESTVATLLGRTSTALNYYLPDGKAEPPALAGGKMVDADPPSGKSETSPPAHAGGSALRARVGSPHVSKGSAAGDGPSLTVGLRTRTENMLIERMQNADTLGQRITYYRAFLNMAASENARSVLKRMLAVRPSTTPSAEAASTPPNQGGELKSLPLRSKDKFDIVTRLLILGDAEAPGLLAELEKTETSDEAKRYAYAARAGIATAENKAKYWNDFVNNKEISESWIEAAFGPWNSIKHSELTLPYLHKALQELPNHKRSRKIFFVNGWLGAFIGGQRSEEALAIVNKFLADNPKLDTDLKLKILENVDVIERAVKIRAKFGG